MKKNLFKLSFVFVLVWFLLSAGQAKADTATTTLDISASNSSPFDGATTTISVLQFDQAAFDWIPASNATVNFGWGATTTDVNGKADITATSSTPFSVSASKTNFLSSDSINITPQVAHANITIRDGATVAFSGVVALPASNAASVYITPIASSSAIAVPARSLLSVLETLDVAQNEFAITNLQYYYFDPPSFYINCMTITSETNPLCGSWQYSLNGINPSVGVDHALLKNGDVVFIYFGNQRQVSLSTTAATVGIPFTATAQKYDPANNAYMASAGFIIGVTQPDPNNPWNPIEIATSTADANGQAVFTVNSVGTYNVGIKEDGNIYDSYFPLTTLTVTAPVSSSGGSVVIPDFGGSQSHQSINVDQAVNFLVAQQNTDGSIGTSLLYSDWAAIALASVNSNGAAGQKIKSYLLTDPNPLVGMNPVSDYARRAMALMSLNISPYDGAKTNYIKKIADSFDGRQFGDALLYNDDIFALFPLLKAGYTGDDTIIQKTIDFILSKQNSSGCWDNVDLTAAAIQALKLAQTKGDLSKTQTAAINLALNKAENYLHNSQQPNGGFGNAISTSWAIQAIVALGEPVTSWQINGQNPLDFLASRQRSDGGFEDVSTERGTRIWTTAYVIPAALGKTWEMILRDFPKPVTGGINQNYSNGEMNLLDSAATSTLEVASSTVITRVATSTPALENNQETTVATSTLTSASLPIASSASSAKNKQKPVKSNRPIVKGFSAKFDSDIKQSANAKINQTEKKDNLTNQNQLNQTGKQGDLTEATVQPDNKNIDNQSSRDKKVKVVFYSAAGSTILSGLFLLVRFIMTLL